MKQLPVTILAGSLFLAGLSNAQSDVTVANFSSRGVVGSGEDIKILGIIMDGKPGELRPVLFRGVGPWLGDLGVSDFVGDPALSLYSHQGLVASNDDWLLGKQRFAIAATGIEPNYESESALIAHLSPGAYTLHLGNNEGDGVGLAEAYFIEQVTLPENLVAAGSFETLVAAVQAAGLLDTLVGDGPFTLFAPTDEAFAALPAGTVEGLLADIPALTNVLLYHVVAGQRILAAQVATGPVVMANGSPASLSTDGGVTIDDANIIEVDWLGSNGVIHVIDSVLLPPPDPASQTIVGNLAAQGNFSTLVAAVQAAGLDATLGGTGPFTLFAPTDAAFAALPAGTVEALLADIPTLTNILLYHVIGGAAVPSSAVTAGPVTMANGGTATLGTEGGVTIDAANVIGADWGSSNGVIHIIDSVILP